MKKYIFVFGLLGLISINSFGQTFSPCLGVTCTQGSDPNYFNVVSNSQVYNFSNWDWTNQEKCNWIAFPNGNPLCINPPFESSTQRFGPIVDVYTKQDYTKAKGWKLVYANFTTNYPYFLLYNEYSGLLRIFFFMPAVTDHYTYYGVTLSYNEGNMPSLLTIGNSNAKALDHYYSGSTSSQLVSSTNNDNYTMVVPMAAQAGWSCSDFLMLYDPNIGQTTFSNTELQIEFWEMDVSQVKLTGDITGSISGPFSMTSGGLNASAHFDVEGAGGKLKDFFDESSSVVGDKIKAGETLGKASSITGAITSLYSLGEMFVGSSEGAADASPDISGLNVGLNVNMTGTLDLKNAFAGTTIPIPGTSANAGSKLYNCPMGVINLSTTPILNRFEYDRFAITSTLSNVAWKNEIGYKGAYHKYQLTNDFNVIANPISGMQLLDVQFAFKCQANGLDDNTKCAAGACDWYDITHSLIKTDNWMDLLYPKSYSFNLPNPVYTDLNTTGRFIIHQNISKPEISNPNILDNNSIFGTPYMKESQIKGIIFDVPQHTNVWLSMMALYKNTTTNVTYIFQQDYQVQINPQWQTSGGEPDGSPGSIGALKINAGVNNGQYYSFGNTCGYTLNANENTCAISYSSYYTSSQLINLSSSATTGTYSAVTVNMNPGYTSQVPFTATALPATNVTGAGIPLPPPQGPAIGNCGNSQGQRIGNNAGYTINTSTPEVTVYPNPSNGQVSIDLNYMIQKKNVSIAVYNTLGTQIASANMETISTGHTDINLSNQPDGIYFVKVNADNNISINKIVVTK